MAVLSELSFFPRCVTVAKTKTIRNQNPERNAKIELTNTALEIQKKLESHDFSSYALLIGYGNQEWQFLSPDVNLDTYFDAASLGKIFPKGSIGHCGWSGQSLYLCRELSLYVILLTNSMRCQNLEKKLKGTARDRAVHQMRIDIHRAIKKDLGL